MAPHVESLPRISSYRVNDPPFPHGDMGNELLKHSTYAIVHANKGTDYNIVGENAKRVAHALGANGEMNGRFSIVAPNGIANELETRGLKVIRPEQIGRCINSNAISEDFGAKWPEVDSETSGALMNALLYQRLAEQHGYGAPRYDLVVNGENDTRYTPFQWMGWVATKDTPLAVQHRQFSPGNEAVQYSSVVFPLHGEVGRNTRKAIEGGWLPASALMTTPEALWLSPTATSPYAHELLIALSTAEQATKENEQLVVVTRAYPDPNISPLAHDKETDVKSTVLEGIKHVLISADINYSAMNPTHVRRINRFLEEAQHIYGPTVGFILPPIESLTNSRRYINSDAARKLLEEIHTKKWVFHSEIHPTTNEDLLTVGLKSGLIPNDKPEAFRDVLTETISRMETLVNPKVVHLGEVGGQVRPVNSRVNDETLDRMLNELRKFRVYNQPYKEGDKSPHAYDINTTDMEAVKARIEEVMKNANVRVVVPFAGEETSIAGVLDYCAQAVGKEKVIAADAGKSRKSTQLAHESGVYVLEQNKTLERIDWEKMIVDGVLPKDFQAKGSKALTMLAAMIKLEDDFHKGKIDSSTWISFHDSDIINPSEYNALHYQFLPEAMGKDVEKTKAVHIAKTGSGRNNGPIFDAINELMKSPDIEVKRLGYSMSRLIWPLTGERMMRWGDIRKFLWTNGMGIETILDAQVAGMDVKDEVSGVVQIANRLPKRENAPSPWEREMGMIQMLGLLLNELGRKSAEFGKRNLDENSQSVTLFQNSPPDVVTTLLPHEWGIEEISKFNKSAGGSMSPVTSADGDSEETNPTILQAVKMDYVLPSIDQMVKYGYLKPSPTTVDNVEYSFK